MQDNKKLVINLRKKNLAELTKFLNALLNARQILEKKGVKIKIAKKMSNKPSPPPVCISKF